MRIEFLNVWGGRLKRDLADHLERQAVNTDVFCFQEADRDFPSIAAEVLGNKFGAWAAFKYVSEHDIFPQAIYVRKELMVEKFRKFLDVTPGIGLGLRCDIANGSNRVTVINIHGISRPGNKLDTPERIQQSAEVLEYSKLIRGPVVIGGDFNMQRETRAIEVFERNGYCNLIKEYGVNTTRNKLAWEKYPDNPQLDSDFVFTRGVKVKSFEVPDEVVSDHQPLILEIN